jgi:hypothetical protein
MRSSREPDEPTAGRFPSVAGFTGARDPVECANALIHHSAHPRLLGQTTENPVPRGPRHRRHRERHQRRARPEHQHAAQTLSAHERRRGERPQRFAENLRRGDAVGGREQSVEVMSQSRTQFCVGRHRSSSRNATRRLAGRP